MNLESEPVASPLPLISLFEDEESRWQAVVSRNANADGFFVYCVKTTKIFCRPICKARLARRANVSFYATGHEAQLAGFRACKRCKPEIAGFMPEEQAVQKIRKFVRNRAISGIGGDEGNMRLSLSQMAKQTGLSKWHFHRVFKTCVGLTPIEYLREQRMLQKTLGDEMHGGQFTWLENVNVEEGENVESLDPGFQFGCWGDTVLDWEQSTASASSTTGSGINSPWSIDDLVSWPEE